MDRRVRSIPTLAFGVGFLAIGLAVVVADSTSLAFGATASVAALAGGVLILVALLFAPRNGSGAGSESESGSGSGSGSESGSESGDVAQEPVD